MIDFTQEPFRHPRSSIRPAEFARSAYARGFVLDEDGNERPLEPHSIPAERGEGLRDLAIQRGASRTLEVGLALGLGSLFLADAVMTAAGSAARHTTINRFQAEHFGNAGLRTIREAGIEGLVEVILEESQLALPRLLTEGRTFDLIYIDGGHHFDSVFVDLFFGARLLADGGIVVVDDTWMESVRLAVTYFERNLDFEVLHGLLPDSFRWTRSRNPLRRGPVWEGTVAVLQPPPDSPDRPWDIFVPFWG